MIIELQVCPGYVKQQRLQSHDYNRDDEDTPEPEIAHSFSENRSE